MLKPGGLYLISTENIASFDNIISMMFGQEPLTQSTSSTCHSQSFLSPHFMKPVTSKHGNLYLHKNVCSYLGLKRLAKINGFTDVNIKSLGNACRLFEKIFKIYNRLIILHGKKQR